ncbi:hypothetical protein [Streptomyces sp. NPDC004528]|uniref:hypothetical protein n=1 Tax=Streptomyces sp. NPDC004528 TaxID=3154550 RepID=UPI0033A60E8D
MTAACAGDTYSHSFEVHSFLTARQVQEIKHLGFDLIAAQMDRDGVKPDLSTLTVNTVWPSRTGAMIRIRTEVKSMGGEH